MTKQFRVGVITTSRADYGIYSPVIDAIDAHLDLTSELFVTGMHMSPEFGQTVSIIEGDGRNIADRIDCLISSDSEEAIALSMGLTTMRFASSLARIRPDIVLVLGDRFEMHSAALAAVPLRLPLAHIHGGEETENAIDNVFRHSLTKLSHLHFTATPGARERIVSMGENADNVVQTGAPALDNVKRLNLFSPQELKEKFSLPAEPFVLATFHPETLSPSSNISMLEAVWNSALATGYPVVFTEANADPMGRAINAWLNDRCGESQGRAQLVGTLGAQGYFSAMDRAVMMIGNSSSGIIEAASFGLPVVNVGDRQKGRERSTNTIDASADAKDIEQAVQKALSDEFRASAADCVNIYGQGNASETIADHIARFLNLEGGAAKTR